MRIDRWLRPAGVCAVQLVFIGVASGGMVSQTQTIPGQAVIVGASSATEVDLAVTATFGTFDPALGTLERIEIDYAYEFDFLLRSLADDDREVGGSARTSGGELLINGTERFSGAGSGTGAGAGAGNGTEVTRLWDVDGSSTLRVGTSPPVWTDAFVGPSGGVGAVSVVFSADVISGISIPPASVSVSLLPESFVTVTYVFAGGLVGDYNASRLVEQGDLNLVLNNWGQARPFEPNGEPFATALVDQEELNRVLNNWGSSSTPSFEGFVVPEPGVALAAAVVILLNRRRGRKRCGEH